MLYKVMDSDMLPYRKWNPNYTGYQYNLPKFADPETGWESAYGDSLDRIVGVIVDRTSYVSGSYSTIYCFGMMDSRYYPSWNFTVWAIDGSTGQLLWHDPSSYGWNLFLMAYKNYFVDLDNRVWTDYLGNCYRTTRFTAETAENRYAKAEGMADLLTYDLYIGKDEWLNTDGNPFSGFRGVDKVLAVVPSENRAIIVYHAPDEGLPAAESGNLRGNYIGIFEFNSKRRVKDVWLPSFLKTLLVVDSQTCYCIHNGGLVSVLDYKRGVITGTLYAGESSFNAGYSSFGLAGVYDPVYRRIVLAYSRPNAEDGASQNNLVAYAPREVPIGITQLVPTKIPRAGRTVPAFARVYGDGGHGIPGVRVDAKIIGNSGNTINPTSNVTDAFGYVKFKYNCVSSGADIDEVQLSADFESESPNIGVEGEPVFSKKLPAAVKSEVHFHPGYWGWSKLSSATPQQKWDSYFGGYVAGDEHPIKGVVQEYKWTDFEPDYGPKDYSKVWADLNYLKSKGLKLTIAIKLHSNSNSETWIPKDIEEYLYPTINIDTGEYVSEPVYARSEQGGAAGKVGVMHLEYTQGYGYYPLLWTSGVYNRYHAFILGLIQEFQGEDTFSGIMPLGSSGVHIRDYQNTRTSSASFEDWRNSYLDQLRDVTSRMTFDWLDFHRYSWGDARTLNTRGTHYAVSGWDIDYIEYDYFAQLGTDPNWDIATGVILRAEDWGQLTNAGTTITPFEMLWGSGNMHEIEGAGTQEWILRQGYFWYIYFELVQPEWSNVDDSILDTCTETTLPLVRAYLG